MKNKKRDSSSRQALLHYQAAIKNTSKPFTLISEKRSSGSSSHYSELLRAIKITPHVRRYALPSDFPSTLKQLELGVRFNTISVDREFKWAFAYLQPYATKLASFAALSQRFHRAVLGEDHSNARNTLEALEKEFGQSLWLIKNKIAYFQMSAGFEAQKLYTAEIIQESVKDGIIPYIAYYVSIRNEPAITAFRFNSIFNEHIKSLDLPEGALTYIRHHILPEAGLSLYDIADILSYEFSVSVIDYFEALLSMARRVISSGFSEMIPSVLSGLKALEPKVNDRRISLILAGLGSKPPRNESADNEIAELLEHFLKGQYKEAMSVAYEKLRLAPDSSDLMEIAARSEAICSDGLVITENHLLRKIVLMMKSVISKDDSTEESRAELTKLALNFHTAPWADAIQGLLDREFDSHPLELRNERIQYSAYGIPYICSLRLISLPDSVTRQSYARILDSLTVNNLGVLYGKAIASEEINDIQLQSLVWEEREIIEIQIALQSKDISKTLIHAQELMKSPLGYYQHLAVKILSNCFLHLGHMDECVSFIASAFLDNRRLRHILPIATAVKALDKPTRKKMSNNLSVPIIFDMYSRFIDHRYDIIRTYTYEDFLFANTIRRPSQLNTIFDKFDLRKVIYFLRYVCVESVMDVSTEFKGSQDIAQERLAVCRLLIDLDADNLETYQNEIKDINRRLMIQRRMRQIEQSKIHVDIESIKRTVQKTVKESFLRYLIFLENKDSIDNMVSMILDILKNSGHTEDQYLIVKVPTEKMRDIFNSMIAELRDQYVSSTEHGLDGYLSVRIRHGTLSGQIRRPLEAMNLVTARDRVTGEYKRNDYWADRIETDNEETRESLASRLASFSREFDELIRMMITDWIQVKKDEKGKGLFDFSFQNLPIFEIEQTITLETSFEEFIDHVFKEFGMVLEKNLQKIRWVIRNDAKSWFSTIMDSLQSYVDQLQGVSNRREITNAIRAAHTEVQVALDRIIEWFRLSKSTSNEPFNIEDAIKISEQSVGALPRGFRADIEINDKGLEFDGRFLMGFVDIFFIIFENILRHSSIVGPPTAKVKVTRNGKLVHFYIDNETGEGVQNDSARNRIASIKAAMTEGKYLKSVTKEGGTGFHKIRKILSHDLGFEPKMDFDFIDERFFVEFTVPIKGNGR